MGCYDRIAFEMLPFDDARKAIEKARLQTGLTTDELDELELLAAKVDLREGMVGDERRLISAQSRLRAFLQRAKTSPYRSEARGWLACACYHLGQYSEAARIYMNEFKAADSNFSSQSLICSLDIVLNKAKPDLAAHIGEYFDTPEHALFVIRTVTNPMYESYDPKLMRQNGARILAEIEKHRSLFANRKDAEELALEMMRVSLAMGDAGRLLQYAKTIPASSGTGQSPDFDWMVGCANFLSHRYEAAERPLRKIVNAPGATIYHRGKAAMALIGVYSKLHRPLDQLDAALQWRQIRNRYKQAEEEIYQAAIKGNHEARVQKIRKRYGLDEAGGDVLNPLLPFTYSAFDLSLLLDMELTTEQLQRYWNAHPDSDAMVPYSLAVRLAREEKYDRAAELYAKAGAGIRQKRMLELQTLYAAAQAPSQTPGGQLQRRFDYARYLSTHSCRVFFNDRLWDSFQTSAFLAESELEGSTAVADQLQAGLTKEERDRIIRRQRRLQDEQEEYWRAYKIFDGIVKASGPGRLGRQAAVEAIRCLDHISERFGREEEIKAETGRLVQWLKSHRTS